MEGDARLSFSRLLRMASGPGSASATLCFSQEIIRGFRFFYISFTGPGRQGTSFLDRDGYGSLLSPGWYLVMAVVQVAGPGPDGPHHVGSDNWSRRASLTSARELSLFRFGGKGRAS